MIHGQNFNLSVLSIRQKQSVFTALQSPFLGNEPVVNLQLTSVV